MAAAAGPIPAPKKILTPNEKGRPLGAKASVFAKEAIAKAIDETKNLNSLVELALKKKYAKKTLSSDQKKIATSISEAIIIGSENNKWNELASQVVNDPSVLDKLGILKSIQDLAGEHQLDTYSASLLYHSTKYSV